MKRDSPIHQAYRAHAAALYREHPAAFERYRAIIESNVD